MPRRAKEAGAGEGGGQILVVGWVVGFGAQWVLRPSPVVVLPVHGDLRAGGVGWRSVVVVGVLVVVAVLVVVMLGMVVPGVVVVVAVVVVVPGMLVGVVLQIFPQDPLALWWDKSLGHHLQPFRRVWGWARRRPVQGCHVPGSVLPTVVVVCGCRAAGHLKMGIWTGFWMGSSCVAASVTAVCAVGVGAQDAVGLVFWWLGHFCCCRCRSCLGCWRCCCLSW